MNKFKIHKIIPGSIALGTGCISALVSRCSKVVESVTVVISSSIYLIEAKVFLKFVFYCFLDFNFNFHSQK